MDEASIRDVLRKTIDLMRTLLTGIATVEAHLAVYTCKGISYLNFTRGNENGIGGCIQDSECFEQGGISNRSFFFVFLVDSRVMQSTEKNLGGVKPWTTSEQKAWLTVHMPHYVASRSSDSKTDFWPPIFEEWFGKWPVTFPGDTMPQNVIVECRDAKKIVRSRVRWCWYDLPIHLSSPSKSGIGSRTIVNDPKQQEKVGFAS